MRARERILIAAVELIEAAGFEGVTIAAVASAAGVSRQTVYSNFGSLEQVVSQSMAAVVGDALGGIKSSVLPAVTACEFVVELIVAGRQALRTHPVLATLVLAERGNPLFSDEMMANAKPFASELLQPLLDRGLVEDDQFEDLVEIAVRLGLSVIVFDSDAVRNDADLRVFLRRWLEPGLATG